MKHTLRRRSPLACALLLGLASPAAHAQTGVSDDRVSLPDGPGSLEGIGDNASVNPNMGSMSYSVPIAVPAGFAGATPSLALSYNSSAGSSVVGIGWSMSLPYIERMTSRGLPSYTRDDLFVADGGDQLVLSAAVSSNEPVYRQRYEGAFARFTWMEAGDGAEGYWKVESPDGSVAYYGATADGRQVDSARFAAPGGTFRYLLTSTVDVYGHEVRYTYEQRGAVPLVSRIEYLFDAAGDATHVVEFSYDDARQDRISDARSGTNELLTSRLTGVRVLTDGAQVRRYALEYEAYDAAGGFSRLRQVQTYGAQDGLYPIAPTFEYQSAVSGEPFFVEMGAVAAGFGSGRASLVDINGDALPDLVDASEAKHRFFVNRVDTATGKSAFDAQAAESDVAESGAFTLGDPSVQMLDFNGDGRADVLNATSRTVLINAGGTNAEGKPDWTSVDSMSAGGNLPSFADGTIRYIDFDGDRRIDLITSTPALTVVYRNDGMGGFTQAPGVQNIGWGFAEDNLELEDMNGDGLADAVLKRAGEVRYKLNLGRGRWTAEVRIENVTLSDAELDFADFEDINGDSLTDLVVVQGNELRYQLNRNGTAFDPPVTLDQVGADDVPVRTAQTTVLYADMNGNGSDDVVYITPAGSVSYIELFPVRPNLMSRITNGIGLVTEVTYTSSVAEQARDGGAESASWPYALPNSMQVVKTIDTYAEQAVAEDVQHDLQVFTYAAGYYDGDEKQFRGYARVEELNEGDETQQSSMQLLEYEVGAEDPYRFGRELRTVILGEQADDTWLPLVTRETDYQDCEVAGLERVDAQFPVRFICVSESREVVQEQAPEAEWKTLVTRSTYNGYGNATVMNALGVADVDGDEVYTEAEFIEPGAATGGRWIIGKAKRVVSYGDPATKATLFRETLNFYDDGAAPFAGLPSGTLSRGTLTRVESRVADGEVIQTMRRQTNADGQTVEMLLPNGSPEDSGAHRVRLAWDANLLVSRTTPMRDAAGEYTLENQFTYDAIFRKPSLANDSAVYVGGERTTPEVGTAYTYDEFGRLATQTRTPGDASKPDQAFSYTLSSPISSARTEGRSTQGGDVDLVRIACLDGLGRTVQSRVRLDGGVFQADGYRVLNRKGQAVRAFQPYASQTDACETSASRVPQGTAFVAARFDALDRPVSATNEDGTSTRVEFAPLARRTFAEDDLDASSPNVDTPLVVREDGLQRVVAYERALAGGDAAVVTLAYDDLGELVEVMDPAGNRHVQSFDALGRVTRTLNPNAGETTFKYDAAENVTERTTAVTTMRFAYDSLNRPVGEWDAADEAGTRATTTYDRLAGCEACTFTAGRAVERRYPLGAEATTDATGSDRMGFDERGNMSYRARRLDGRDFESRFVYDNANRLIEHTYPDGTVETRTYDALDRVTSIPGVLNALEFDARGSLVSMTRSNGVVDSTTYDARLRPTGMRATSGGAALFGIDLTLTADGSVASIADRGADRAGRPHHGVGLTSDAWHRPTQVVYGADASETLTYTFDDLDNVLAITSSDEAASPAHVGTLTYDAARPNAVVSAGDEARAYDEVGRLITHGDRTLERDWRGAISRVTRDGEVAEVSVYASQNDRVMKRSGDSVTYYIEPGFEVRDGVGVRYTMLNERLARTSSDTLAAKVLSDLAPATADGGALSPVGDGHIDAGDAWLAQAAEAGVLALSGGPVPSAVAQLLAASARRTLLDDAPEAVHLHADQLGSVVLATSASGEVVGEQAFYATGEVRAATAFVDAYGFTGQERDTGSGMLHFAFRNLDTRTGRWDAPDPLFNVLSAESVQRLGESTSAYGFVANQPFDANDPTGLLSWAGVKASVKNWAATRVSPRTWWRQKQANKQWKKGAPERARRMNLSLESILQDPAETAALGAFTANEFSTESFKFLEAVRGVDAILGEQFRGDSHVARLKNATQVRFAVDAVVNNYIRQGSADQVNLLSTLRNDVIDAVQQAKKIEHPIKRAQALRKALIPAEAEAFRLLQTDNLPRFRTAIEEGRF